MKKKTVYDFADLKETIIKLVCISGYFETDRSFELNPFFPEYDKFSSFSMVPLGKDGLMWPKCNPHY